MRVNTDGVMLGAWAHFSPNGRILDVGTGTGIIALMLAQRGAQSIDAIDIDQEAYLQALDNVTRSPWSESIHVFRSSFQEWAESCEKGYDTIISNPPYFSQSLHSPDAARNLTRHNDMLPFEDIIAGLSLCLNPGGTFSAIFPLSEGTKFISNAAEAGLFCRRFVSIASRPGSPTKRILCELRHEGGDSEVGQISIHAPDGSFSQEYRRLTSDFYLAF